MPYGINFLYVNLFINMLIHWYAFFVNINSVIKLIVQYKITESSHNDITLHDILLYHNISHLLTSFNIMSYKILFYLITLSLSYFISWIDIIIYFITWYVTLPNYITRYLLTSHLVISHNLISCHIRFYHITSYHITSYYIISYLISCQIILYHI